MLIIKFYFQNYKKIKKGSLCACREYTEHALFSSMPSFSVSFLISSPMCLHMPFNISLPLAKPVSGLFLVVHIFHINFECFILIQNHLVCTMRFCWLITPSHANISLRSFIDLHAPPKFFSNFIFLRMKRKSKFLEFVKFLLNEQKITTL